MDLNDLGTEFNAHALRRQALLDDPFQQFERWMAQALEAKVTQPNAMTLSTVSPEGQPSARIVYLKGMDHRGFVFFTNYRSRKAAELAHNAKAALMFYWPELNQQVRIEGPVAKTTEEESDDYFASRSRPSQLGAWASEQSDLLTSRDTLEQRYQAVQTQFPKTVPRPDHWGGYRLAPSLLEFWQGRQNRCHDRFVYRVSPQGWTINRLAP